MYSKIKEEKVFDKYMEIWKKVNYIIKKSIVSLYIYIERETERQRDRETERQRESKKRKRNTSAGDID